MVRRETAILWSINAVGSVLLGLIASQAIIWVALPLIHKGVNLPAMQRTLDEASARSTELLQANSQAEKLLAEATRRQQEEFGRTIFDETQIAGLVARECKIFGVHLQRTEPLHMGDIDKLAVHDVRVVGRGEFPNIYRLLAKLEATSPYLEIRDIQISNQRTENVCEFSWVIRCRDLPPARADAGEA